MKSIKSIALIMLISMGFSACGQTVKNAKTETFEVWGNCGMCKKTIEKAANSVKGVGTAVWDVDKKIMTLTYDSIKTNTTKVQQAIAAAGYDTPLAKGDDKAYTNLHECCQYDRKKE